MPYQQELPIPKDVETRDSSIPNKPKSQMKLKFAGVQRRNLGLQSNLDTNLHHSLQITALNYVIQATSSWKE